MAGKGSGPNQVLGYKYFMSLHMALCRGPVNSIVEIRVGDLTAFNTEITTTGEYAINAPNLFGGEDKEGGIQGRLYAAFGEVTQVIPSWIKTILGGLVPDFRRVTTLFFDGLVCVNNPYPKQWKMRVRRSTAGWENDTPWYPEKCVIDVAGDASVDSMNGAHIIYECCTNTAWGRGLAPALIGDTAFRAAADTLYTEGFGLCLRWNRQDDIDKFVQVVLNHIGGVVFIDRATGLLTLKLIRNDYDPGTLDAYTYDSGLLEITTDDLTPANTMFNEVVVNWHEPVQDQDRQVRIQNLGSIQALGYKNSTTVDYPGIATAPLAQRLAQRDVMAQANIRKITVKLDRRAWTINPGDVFKISAPSRGINNMILRAGEIREDSIANGSAITIQAVQDVFTLPLVSYGGVEAGGYVPPDRSAQVVATRFVTEMSYRDAVHLLSPSDLSVLDPTMGAIKVFAKRPTTLSVDYLIDDAAGAEDFAIRGRNSFSPTASLNGAIDTYDTSISFDNADLVNLAPVGFAAVLGGEVVRIDAIDADAGTATIARGCLDTIPAPHADNTRIWFEDGLPGGDGREYSTGETIHVKLLTRTNSQQLNPALAPTDDLNIQGRQGRPYPPGDVQVDGTRFANVTTLFGNLNFTWAHRDRVMQSDFLLEHGAASTGPEPGTTYTIRVYDDDGVTLLRTVSGITGTSWTYTTAMQATDGNPTTPWFELVSIRDGLTSFQKYRFSFGLVQTGFDFGFDYDFDG